MVLEASGQGSSQTTSSTPAATSTAPLQTSAPESAGAGTNVGATPPVTPTPGVSAAAHGAADPNAPVAYKPNLKFKVLGQEKEFDPFMADVIKDEATEKAVRDLYERAHGIDSVKADRKKYQDAFNELLPQHQEITTRIERLQGYIDAGNISAFQRETGITDTMILKRAQDILAAMENPALKKQEEDGWAAEQRVINAQTQNQALVNQVLQARTFELNTVLSRPDVQSVMNAFDARMGQGAFRREVINRGSMYHNVYQVDKSAEELVNEIMGFMGSGAAPQTPQVVPAQPVVNAQGEGNPEEPQGTRVVPPKKPVVPNLSGKGTSPVKKTIKNLDDLRQHAKEFAAANG